MNALHAFQQSNATQRAFLAEVVVTAWPGEVQQFESFVELARASGSRDYDLVFLELQPGSERQLEWLEIWGQKSVGLVSRQWEGSELGPFLERGLSDYILKPYQPEKITRMVRARRRTPA